MQSSQSLTILMNKRLSRQTETLNSALQLLKDNGVQGADQALSLVPLTIETRNQKIYDELLEKFYDYCSPMFTLSQWIKATERHKYLIHQYEKQKQHWRLMAAYDTAINQSDQVVLAVGHAPSNHYDTFLHTPDNSLLSFPPSTGIIDNEFQGNRFVIREDNILYSLDPISLEPSTVPLRFSGEPSLSDFKYQIHFFPSTKIVNLPKTLSSVLDRAQVLGYSKKQLQVLFKIYCESYNSDLYYVIENTTTPLQTFKVMLDLIFNSDVVTQVNSQLKGLTRSLGESIHSLFMRHKALLVLKLSNTQTDLTPERIEQKADNVARSHLIYYIESNTRESFMQYLREQNSIGETVGVRESLQFINDLEQMDSSFQLKEDKTYAAGSDITLMPAVTRMEAKTGVGANNPKPRSQLTPKKRGRGRGRGKANVTFGDQNQQNTQKSNHNNQNTRGRGGRGRQNGRGRRGNNRGNQNTNQYNNSNQNTKNRGNQQNQGYNQNSDGQGYRGKRNYQNNNQNQNQNRGRGGRGRGRGRGGRGGQKNQGYYDNRNQYNNTDQRQQQNQNQQQELHCLRCRSKQHSSEQCDLYFVTTIEPCFKCGVGAGHHFSHCCMGTRHEN